MTASTTRFRELIPPAVAMLLAVLIPAVMPRVVGAQLTTAGAEFQVNTYSSYSQVFADVAVAGDGDFVIVWKRHNGDDLGVFGQRYDSGGSALGGEFQVNTAAVTADHAMVAAAADGRFVVVWESYGHAFGRRFDSAGGPVGGEFQVNATTNGSEPAVAMDADGDFVIVWQSLGDGDYSGVFGQRFDSAGSPAGGELQVNTTTTGHQGGPAVAMDADGDFVVVWASLGDGDSFGVFGQRFDGAGSPAGGEFQVNTTTSGSQGGPVVAMNAGGDFVVVWHYDLNYFGQRFDGAGNALGTEFQVDSSPYYLSNYSADVAMNDAGDFVVVWTSIRDDPYYFGVFGQQFDSGGSPVGGELLVSAAPFEDREPAIASSGAGEMVVAWEDTQYGSDVDIFAQRYAPPTPIVLAVSPDSGTFLGGESVTITGSNFADPPTVRIGGEVSPAVVFLSDTELQAETPAHYPALVDVEVENPGGEVTRQTNAFTFIGNTATLTLPPAATGDRLTTVQLAVDTPSIEGLVSADLTVGFDPAILTASVVTTGSLTAGFSVAANTAVAGEVTISMAGAVPVSGAGDLALLDLQVIGPPAATTPLTLAVVELNAGAIPTSPVNGQFTVNNAFDVGGTVSYYQGAQPVAATRLDIVGSGAFSTTSDAAGAFVFPGLPSGTYTLTPVKSDGHSPTVISPLDASLVLQHSAGIITLSGHQATAADVNKASAIDAFDASLILQYASDLLGLPFPGSPEVWDFDPSFYSYVDLDLDQVAQDFTGILIGDPSGNWLPGGEAVAARTQESTATLSFDDHVADPGASISIELATDGADGVLAVLATVEFERTVLRATDVRTTAYTGGFALAANMSDPGRVVIAMASAEPLAGGGDLLTIDFEVVGGSGSSSSLDLVSADLNEGAIEAILIDGAFRAHGDPTIFADGFESGDTSAW
ncbi:MAG: hypothetical protein GY719_34820 [bacterium]|nr:hypothetical protein [bacterium]